VSWKKDGQTGTLPGIAAKQHCGAERQRPSDLSRYTTFAAEDCDSDFGRWMVLSHFTQSLNRRFLETDALHFSGRFAYASLKQRMTQNLTLAKPTGMLSPVSGGKFVDVAGPIREDFNVPQSLLSGLTAPLRFLQSRCSRERGRSSASSTQSWQSSLHNAG